jgi:hypothetical protein
MSTERLSQSEGEDDDEQQFFTHEEAYARYASRFSSQSVCNHNELAEIFAASTNWNNVLDRMAGKIGTSGPVTRK